MSPNYSILDRLERDPGAGMLGHPDSLRNVQDGKFHFKLIYPLKTSANNYNWWKQSLNPFDYPNGFEVWKKRDNVLLHLGQVLPKDNLSI